MSVEKGSAFLLKVANGGSPVTYATIAGLRITQLGSTARRRPGAAASATGGSIVDAEARAAVAVLVTQLISKGILAAS